MPWDTSWKDFEKGHPLTREAQAFFEELVKETSYFFGRELVQEVGFCKLLKINRVTEFAKRLGGLTRKEEEELGFKYRQLSLADLQTHICGFEEGLSEDVSCCFCGKEVAVKYRLWSRLDQNGRVECNTAGQPIVDGNFAVRLNKEGQLTIISACGLTGPFADARSHLWLLQNAKVLNPKTGEIVERFEKPLRCFSFKTAQEELRRIFQKKEEAERAAERQAKEAKRFLENEERDTQRIAEEEARKKRMAVERQTEQATAFIGEFC